MPHSAECERETTDGWCMGRNCTLTKDDWPQLFEFLEKYRVEQGGRSFGLPDMRHRQREERMTFEVTPDHMRLVERLYWDEAPYEGVPQVNPKRPYGNSDIAGDIAEVLGWPTPWQDRDDDMPNDVYERAMKIHAEVSTVLQIITCTLSCRAGTYEKKTFYDALSWERVDDGR